MEHKIGSESKDVIITADDGTAGGEIKLRMSKREYIKMVVEEFLKGQIASAEIEGEGISDEEAGRLREAFAQAVDSVFDKK